MLCQGLTEGTFWNNILPHDRFSGYQWLYWWETQQTSMHPGMYMNQMGSMYRLFVMLQWRYGILWCACRVESTQDTRIFWNSSLRNGLEQVDIDCMCLQMMALHRKKLSFNSRTAISHKPTLLKEHSEFNLFADKTEYRDCVRQLMLTIKIL